MYFCPLVHPCAVFVQTEGVFQKLWQMFEGNFAELKDFRSSRWGDERPYMNRGPPSARAEIVLFFLSLFELFTQSDQCSLR